MTISVCGGVEWEKQEGSGVKMGEAEWDWGEMVFCTLHMQFQYTMSQKIAFTLCEKSCCSSKGQTFDVHNLVQEPKFGMNLAQFIAQIQEKCLPLMFTIF